MSRYRLPAYFEAKYIGNFCEYLGKEYGGRWRVTEASGAVSVRCLWCGISVWAHIPGWLSETLKIVDGDIHFRHRNGCPTSPLAQGGVGGVLDEAWPPGPGIASPGASESVLPSAHEALGVPIYAGKKVKIPRFPANTVGGSDPLQAVWCKGPMTWNSRPVDEYLTVRRALARFQVQPKPEPSPKTWSMGKVQEKIQEWLARNPHRYLP